MNVRFSMNNSDRDISNGIELLNRNVKKVAVLELYRVMWIGRLDKPDEDVEFQEILSSSFIHYPHVMSEYPE